MEFSVGKGAQSAGLTLHGYRVAGKLSGMIREDLAPRASRKASRFASLHLVFAALVATSCGSEQSARSNRSVTIAPDSIDSLVAHKQTIDSEFARVGAHLLYVQDSTQFPTNAEAIIRISRTRSGRPLRYVESPVSESGDWSLALIHYFDALGRTQQFVSSSSYFGGDCARDIIVDRSVTRYRSDFTVASSTRTLHDDRGLPVDSTVCVSPPSFFAGHPYRSFDDLHQHDLAR